MTDIRVLSVSRLTASIRETLKREFPFVAVEGEISGWKKHGSGHRYFSLKDADARISAVLWRGTPIPMECEDGMTVIVHGEVSVYDPRGQYQLVVRAIQPVGIGDLFRRFEALKDELKTAGYFDIERKKTLPQFPKTIGIITAATGAAIQDMTEILSRRAPWIHIVLFPVDVQGSSAAGQIANAIKTANQTDGLDLLIIGRGGGSIEDLWAFNERAVADAIYQSSVPIVSAVGHETDTTISDWVADVRAATPSEAAEIVAPEKSTILHRIDHLHTAMQELCHQRFLDNHQRLHMLEIQLDRGSPMAHIHTQQQRLDFVLERFYSSIASEFSEIKNRVLLASEKLQALDPQSVFERGFSVATDLDGKIVRHIRHLTVDDRMRIRFADGHIVAKTEEIYYAENEDI